MHAVSRSFTSLQQREELLDFSDIGECESTSEESGSNDELIHRPWQRIPHRGLAGVSGVVAAFCLLALARLQLRDSTSFISSAGSRSFQGKAATVEPNKDRDYILAKLDAESNISFDAGKKFRDTHCSGPGEDCASTGCCKEAGSQCFSKHETWSACRPYCVAGAPDLADKVSEPWSCDPLGPPTPGEYVTDYTLKPSPWVSSKCSGTGESCNVTKCCKDKGMQCYEKEDGWAACKPYCDAGPDPTDGNPRPWSCKTLSYRTPGAYDGDWGSQAASWVQTECAVKGDSCMKSRCCKDPGYQCYMKQGEWATCRQSCIPGPMLTDQNADKWNCTALGGRTPGSGEARGEIQVAPWVKSKCTTIGNNCNETLCCTDEAHQCYEKHFGWAQCMTNCKPEYGTCKTLGPRTPRIWKHPSLYCFSIFQVWSYEADIIRMQINTDGGVGIFGCELADVFSTDGATYMGDGPNGPVVSHYFDFARVGKSEDNTAANTRLFINAWYAVRAVGNWKLADFTIKADPDAVIIADRLRAHVKQIQGRPAFMINCNKPGMSPMMFGSIEVISREGMTAFFNRFEDQCMGMPLDAWGEDKWLGNCLNHIGAPGSGDFTLVSDGVCTGLDCASGRAAFHPLKDKGKWLQCYRAAMR